MSPSTSPEPETEPAKLNKVKTQRARWATRKMTVKSGRSKRNSILNRRHNRGQSTASEKGQAAGDGEPPFSEDDLDAGGPHPGDGEGDDDADEVNDNRTVFFNQPLPAEFLDEEGHPLADFARNKIRTAKYTPLSFIPKNLWFQFQNIANIFFLITNILVVCICSTR